MMAQQRSTENVQDTTSLLSHMSDTLSSEETLEIKPLEPVITDPAIVAVGLAGCISSLYEDAVKTRMNPALVINTKRKEINTAAAEIAELENQKRKLQQEVDQQKFRIQVNHGKLSLPRAYDECKDTQELKIDRFPKIILQQDEITMQGKFLEITKAEDLIQTLIQYVESQIDRETSRGKVLEAQILKTQEALKKNSNKSALREERGSHVKVKFSEYIQSKQEAINRLKKLNQSA